MIKRISIESQRGATLVEFALGSVVFMSLLAGVISLSIFLADRILVTRALDKALDRVVADSRFREDTHLSTGSITTTEKWNRVNAARNDAINDAMAFLGSTWIAPSLLVYSISPPSSTTPPPTVNSRIAIMRPAGAAAVNSGGLGGTGKAVRNSQEEWIYQNGADKIEQLYTFGGSSCSRGSTSYNVLLQTCPYIALATVEWNVFPFGKIRFTVKSVRFAELPKPASTPALFNPWTTRTNDNPFTPRPTATDTPLGNPTATATNTRTVTPTPINTPNCDYDDQKTAEDKCSEGYGGSPSDCVQVCGDNYLMYNCKIPCHPG